MKTWEITNNAVAKDSNDVVRILLENRGIVTKKEREQFLRPNDLARAKPEELEIDKEQFNKAIQRIKLAHKNKEGVLIFGDYDADGICATAIMWEALYYFGINAKPYIPDRFTDGYGLSEKSIRKLKSENPNLSLIITVDNGIVANQAVAAAGKLGIEVIVTDHHTVGKSLPPARAVIHSTKASGSGIAYFLAKEFSADKSLLALAAIGTVADQLPLAGINRSIVKYGIEELNATKRIGLKKLFAAAGLIGKTISTYEINFAIAPRLNAGGRIDSAMESLRLLCTRNSSRAGELAQKLNNLNNERQRIVEESVEIAHKMAMKQKEGIIVVYHNEFHEGVIGLIASKLVETYWRPAIVFSSKGEIAKASARSIDGFDIIKTIRSTGSLVIEGGGHKMAAGFSVKTENINIFTKKVNKQAKQYMDETILTRKLKVDLVLRFSLINRELYNSLLLLEPHGAGNPAPLFVSEGVVIKNAELVGGGKHLKLLLAAEGKEMSAIAFNNSQMPEEKQADVAYRINESSWNGKVELIIKDIEYGRRKQKARR